MQITETIFRHPMLICQNIHQSPCHFVKDENCLVAIPLDKFSMTCPVKTYQSIIRFQLFFLLLPTDFIDTPHLPHLDLSIISRSRKLIQFCNV